MSVIVGYVTDSRLMLDPDMHEGKDVVRWAKEHTRRYDLGSALVMLTSEVKQKDILGKKELNNYCIIFGKLLPQEEILMHNENAFRDGIIHENFLQARIHEGVTIERVTRSIESLEGTLNEVSFQKDMRTLSGRLPLHKRQLL